MKKFALLLLTVSLHANIHYNPSLAVTEGMPESFIDGNASVITSDLYLQFNDLTVIGAEPLALPRTYLSSHNKKGGWFFFDHLIAKLHTFQPNLLFISEPHGTEIFFECLSPNFGKPSNKKSPYTFRVHSDFFLEGITNARTENISAKTSYLNYEIKLDRTFDKFTLRTANGTQKLYQRFFLGGTAEYAHYLLIKETRPNKNIIRYYYTDDGNLQRIQSSNPSGKKTYAWMNLDWEYNSKKTKLKTLHITTSDNQELTYTFTDHKHQQYITSVNENPLTYLEKNNTGYLLESTLEQTFDYQNKKLILPPTENSYALTSSNRIDTITKPTHTEKYLWKGHLLKGKITLSSNSAPLSALIYTYDQYGNIITEKTYKPTPTIPLLLSTDYLPIDNGIPCIQTTRIYDEDHNLLQEASPGHVHTYTYTNSLLTAESINQTNITYEYNEDNILTSSTIQTPEETTTYTIHPRTNPPFIGLPEIVEEKTSQGTTRTLFTYTPQGTLARKDIFHNGTYSHSLHPE